MEDEWISESGDCWTRKTFLTKMEWEGGLVDMIGWGGAGCFPPSLREMARGIEEFEFGEDEDE
jgi:hypothetical protein